MDARSPAHPSTSLGVRLMRNTDTLRLRANVTDAIELALLREYPWERHDCWKSDEECQVMLDNGLNPWPHLSHVVEVAANAAVAAFFEERLV